MFREGASKITLHLFVYYFIQIKEYIELLFTIHFQSGFTKLYKPPVSKPKQNVPNKTQVKYLRSSKPRGGAMKENAR